VLKCLHASLQTALMKEHPEEREHADGDGYGGDRSPQNVAFPTEKASGRGREDHALRGEHAGVTPGDVLHRGRELLRHAESPRSLDLERHEQRVRSRIGSG
jgi:hypothetical protein